MTDTIRRRAASVLAVGAIGAAVALGTGEPVATAAQPATFRASGDAVRVFVTVTDDDGRIVATLTQDDFEIRDDGEPQPITVFDASPQPVRLVVMLDVSGSMEGNLPLLHAATEALVARLLPEDLVRIGTFGEAIVMGEAFARDPEVLRAALPDEIRPDAPTPLWAALDEAMNGFDETEAERRVVLVLSDGRDTGSLGRRPFGAPEADQAGVIDRARDDDVMIYAVGMRSRGGRQRQPGRFGVGRDALRAALLADAPDSGLARVADDTGGGYLEIDYGEDLGAAFARVADELHSQYLIGFAPPERDGRVHEIDVRLTQRGLRARARQDYRAPRD